MIHSCHVGAVKCNLWPYSCIIDFVLSVCAFNHIYVPREVVIMGHNMKLFQMVWCVWLEETVPGRVGSKFSTTVTGGQYVTTTGPSSMQRWSADSWATGTETVC